MTDSRTTARPRSPLGKSRRLALRRSRHGIALILAIALTAVALSGCTTPSEGAPQGGSSAEVVSRVGTLDLLREAADHEALFTLVGGLKPMSSGIWKGAFTVEAPDLSVLRQVRAALAPLRNEIWYADVQVFASMHDGKRMAHAYVVHRAALAGKIEHFASFWGRWGITPCTHPAEIVAVVDRMPRADRWRGYGYLFGYPSAAVDFFVEAGRAGDDGRKVGPGKDRRFIQIPTHAAPTGRFTYAVPLAHQRSAADDALAAAAARILEAYAERRDGMTDVPRMITELRRLNQRFDVSTAGTAAASSHLP